jgi:pimeloyl-ACP methyl ester carboxylesterase
MSSVVSSDGTAIAFEAAGAGLPVIIVDGALAYREVGPSAKLAAELSRRFTVYRYDRRGRGGSGDASTYSVEREIDDIQALIDRAGGSASLVGISSGGVLALEAASRRLPVTKLVVYEAPAWLKRASDAVAGVLPSATRRTIEGANHMMQADRVGPVLTPFLLELLSSDDRARESL